MATKLTAPLTRQLALQAFRIPVMLTIHPDGRLEFWEKGSRQHYESHVGQLLTRAAMLAARKER